MSPASLGSVTDAGACEAVWAALAPEERTVYERAGYHRRFGLGNSPALVIVDVEYNFTGVQGDSVLTSVQTYPDSCGPAAWRAMPAIAELLGGARHAGIPIVFTHGMPGDEPPGRHRRGTDIVDELLPNVEEAVLAKSAASAFHGTGLAERLQAIGIDTVLHAGCTTSGCVRASVVDAAAYGFRPAVVEECVFDRAVLPHQVSLFDMDAKYGDVISLSAATSYLAERSVVGQQAK